MLFIYDTVIVISTNKLLYADDPKIYHEDNFLINSQMFEYDVANIWQNIFDDMGSVLLHVNRNICNLAKLFFNLKPYFRNIHAIWLPERFQYMD